jgi:hypothetical protein
MSHPPHPHWFNHLNNIRWRIQAVKFIIMQFSRRPSSSLLCSQKFLVYVSPPKWETKFRTHTAQLAKLQFCIF